MDSLNPHISYDNASRIAKIALQKNQGIIELLLQERLLNARQLEAALNPAALVSPH